MSEETKRNAQLLFEALQAEFPHLLMRIKQGVPEVDVEAEILRQPGLAFDVHLASWNDDELYLGVGEFWGSWFPSTRVGVVQKYRNAVSGLLSGRNRIVEYVRWGRFIGADLQALTGTGWKTIYCSRGGLLPVSWRSTERILRNEAAN